MKGSGAGETEQPTLLAPVARQQVFAATQRVQVQLPGLATEEIRGMMEAVSSPRISTAYVPSITEWLLTVGIVGLGLLLFGIGEMLLPKDEKELGHVSA